MENKIFKEAYIKSLDLLKSLVAGPESGNIGFFASAVNKDNYKRVFARDAFWIFMASILSQDRVLIKGCKDSIRTLSKYQREDGAIPSNVSADGKVSYGIINPRVDSTTLYIIGCIRFARRYPNEKILEDHFESIKKAFSYLENMWENKKYELLFIPRAGNWADEYLQQGIVLYDEVLWYMAVKEYSAILKKINKQKSDYYGKKAARIKKLINEKFWTDNLDIEKGPIVSRLSKKFDFEKVGYYIHFFYSPDRHAVSFNYPQEIFDAFGNILAILAELPSQQQIEKIINFIEEISINKYRLIPAHYPFFPEETFRSQKLHQFRFKQFVGHYHNGGLWSWYAGPFVAAMVKNARIKIGLRYCRGIIKANNEKKDGMDFYEYHTGKSAAVYLKVRYSQGIDLYLSVCISKFVKYRKSTVLIHFKGEKVNAESDIGVRALGIKRTEEIKVSAVGPDAQEVITGIVELTGPRGRKVFDSKKINLKGSKAGGTAYLGVSAAAYVIAYTALFEKRIIFDNEC
ncbi:MAG: glycoside hydrolase 100 family protein [Candidatus Omnitrophota bacterium]